MISFFSFDWNAWSNIAIHDDSAHRALSLLFFLVSHKRSYTFCTIVGCSFPLSSLTVYSRDLMCNSSLDDVLSCNHASCKIQFTVHFLAMERSSQTSLERMYLPTVYHFELELCLVLHHA
jgi:hypothetical protein